MSEALAPPPGACVDYPSPQQVASATALATMGALPLGQVPDDAPDLGEWTPLLYATAAAAGAGGGGALVGYLSAGDWRGAFTGGCLTFGLGGLANAVYLVRKTDHRAQGALVGLGGLGFLIASLALAASRPET